MADIGRHCFEAGPPCEVVADTGGVSIAIFARLAINEARAAVELLLLLLLEEDELLLLLLLLSLLRGMIADDNL